MTNSESEKGLGDQAVEEVLQQGEAKDPSEQQREQAKQEELERQHRRGLAAALAGVSAVLEVRAVRASGWRKWLWMALGGIATVGEKFLGGGE